jgi:hypothetical protein
MRLTRLASDLNDTDAQSLHINPVKYPSTKQVLVHPLYLGLNVNDDETMGWNPGQSNYDGGQVVWY